MIQMIDQFVADQLEISVSPAGGEAKRSGFRTFLSDACAYDQLWNYVAGQLPYYYREPITIAEDFRVRRHALENLRDLISRAPTAPEFQRSHFGEILSSLYIENVLGYSRLLSKLTLPTAENTNVHKMDAMFVNRATDPYEYVFVEAKCSIKPQDQSGRKSHRSGILRQMVESLGHYSDHDERFDFTTIRDHLERGFSTEEAQRIRQDLTPPGPYNLRYLGVACVTHETINQKDDDYILTVDSERSFDFQGIAVSDVLELADKAYAEYRPLLGAT